MDYSMNTAPLTVTQPVQLELIDASGAATPIEAELRYDANDPFAVTTVFRTGTSEVRWTFGRDLLAEGLYLDRKLDFWAKRYAAIAALTADQVNATIKRHLRLDALVKITSGDKKKM